ncbi:MAG: hypothetical protein ACE37F_00735 [Nannocystaceae bacterium]|nr:hypothetical protein [bacterium]
MRDDDREEALLLADECTDDGQYGLFAHVLDDEQQLSDAPIRIGDVSLPLPPLSWTILPGSDGGYSRIVVAGPGYTMLLSLDRGGPLTASDLGAEAVPLEFTDDDGAAEQSSRSTRTTQARPASAWSPATTRTSMRFRIRTNISDGAPWD